MKVKKEDKVINIQSGLIFFIAGFRDGICKRDSDGVFGIEEKFLAFWEIFGDEKFVEYFPIGETKILEFMGIFEKDLRKDNNKFLKIIKRYYQEAIKILERMEKRK
jgi:hypothetical protein